MLMKPSGMITSTRSAQPCLTRMVAPKREQKRAPSRVCAASNEYRVVADAMTTGDLFVCSATDTVDDALQQLVTHRITGLPVVDANNKVVGVVSDYDLLALDTLGKVNNDVELFPSPDQTWQAFNAIKALLAKTSGKRIEDVMTKDPVVVEPNMDLDRAAKLLLMKKVHRLPVVDANGSLVGVLSRGNIIKAVLAQHQAAKAAAAAQAQ